LIALSELRTDVAAILSTPFEAEIAADYMGAITTYKAVTLNSVSSYAGI